MAAHAINARGVNPSAERRLGPSPLFVLLKHVAGKLADSWAWYLEYRRTERELTNLTNRELDDIGIARCDIPWIALETANAKSER
ncbi:MAG: DUF1127 domain-containing protein [Pseudomonadota bacterium]